MWPLEDDNEIEPPIVVWMEDLLMRELHWFRLLPKPCVCRTETNRPHVAVQSPYLAVGAISIAMSA